MPGEKFLDGRQSHRVIKIGQRSAYAPPVGDEASPKVNNDQKNGNGRVGENPKGGTYPHAKKSANWRNRPHPQNKARKPSGAAANPARPQNGPAAMSAKPKFADAPVITNAYTANDFPPLGSNGGVGNYAAVLKKPAPNPTPPFVAYPDSEDDFCPDLVWTADDDEDSSGEVERPPSSGKLLPGLSPFPPRGSNQVLAQPTAVNHGFERRFTPSTSPIPGISPFPPPRYETQSLQRDASNGPPSYTYGSTGGNAYTEPSAGGNTGSSMQNRAPAVNSSMFASDDYANYRDRLAAQMGGLRISETTGRNEYTNVPVTGHVQQERETPRYGATARPSGTQDNSVRYPTHQGPYHMYGLK